MGLFVAEIVWGRPWAAWLLLLPLALVLLARRRGRPPEAVIGTLALWRDSAPAVSRARAYRRRVPPAVLFAALGLVLGTLALSDPRASTPPLPRVWTVVVDRSPSMGLAAPPPATGTRVERGVELALAELAQVARAGDRVRWDTYGRAELELRLGEPPPASWLALDPAPAPELDLARWDRAGYLLVTDVLPEPNGAAPPGRAGLAASGAAPVPGPVAVQGLDLLVWSGGSGLTREPGAAPTRLLVAPETGLPPAMERFLESWCGGAGVRRGVPGDAGAALRLELGPLPGGPAGGASWTGEVGRDGWRARARVVESSAREADAGLVTWLSLARPGGGEVPAVRFGPGRVQWLLRELGEPRGDPAAFPVSLARLFEAALLAPPALISLDERRRAGPERRQAPRAAPRAAEVATVAGLAPPPSAWLAFAATLCAAVSALLAVSRPRS